MLVQIKAISFLSPFSVVTRLPPHNTENTRSPNQPASQSFRLRARANDAGGTGGKRRQQVQSNQGTGSKGTGVLVNKGEDVAKRHFVAKTGIMIKTEPPGINSTGIDGGLRLAGCLAEEAG